MGREDEGKKNPDICMCVRGGGVNVISGIRSIALTHLDATKEKLP